MEPRNTYKHGSQKLCVRAQELCRSENLKPLPLQISKIRDSRTWWVSTIDSISFLVRRITSLWENQGWMQIQWREDQLRTRTMADIPRHFPVLKPRGLISHAVIPRKLWTNQDFFAKKLSHDPVTQAQQLLLEKINGPGICCSKYRTHFPAIQMIRDHIWFMASKTYVGI